MRKNGSFFLSIVNHAQVRQSIWDPYSYRANRAESLGAYVQLSNLRCAGSHGSYTRSEPIKYRDISKGNYLSFALRLLTERTPTKGAIVCEDQLLFGTMRAYLGNVLVTPRAEWLGLDRPQSFPVKSEFVVVVPHDGCTYFWWAYLRSAGFLSSLPLGSGGTRPRLQNESLLLTPAKVPPVEVRRTVHRKLEASAEQEWKEYMTRLQILNSVDL